MANTPEEITLQFKALGIGDTVTQITKIGNAMQKATYQMDKQGEIIEKSTSRTLNMMPKFQFYWLSIMFLAMQAQRMMMGFWTSAAQTMTKIDYYTGAWHKQTLKLSAAWEYFKFVLLDTLAQSPLFQMLVQALIDLATWLSNLDPTQLQIVAGIMVGFTALAIGAGIFSQIATLIMGLRTAGIVGEGLLLTLGKIGLALAGVAIMTIGFAITWKGLEKGDYMMQMAGAIAAILGATFLGFMLGGAAGAGVGFLFAIAGLVAISLIFDMTHSQKNYDQWKENMFDLPEQTITVTSGSIEDMATQIKNGFEGTSEAIKTGVEDPIIASNTALNDTNALLAASLLSTTTPETLTKLGSAIDTGVTKNMDKAKGSTVALNAELALIPKEIHTYHYIHNITVNEERGGA